MHRRLTMMIPPRTLLLLAVVALPLVARADGGRLQMSKQVGSWQVSVFTTPTPIRVGIVDISVLVQDTATLSPVADASVTFKASPPDGHGHAIVARASHAAATNQLLQAANLHLPHAGAWNIKLTIQSGQQRAELQVPIKVASALPSWQAMWPWWSLPVWPIVLFVLYKATSNSRTRS